jgi:hypothetical protein
MTSTILIAATTLTSLFSDSFEFVRVSTMGSYRAAYCIVRVLGPNHATLVEVRTDRYGRVRFDLPVGTYDAEATEGKRTFRFRITIAGSNTVKRIELK